MSGTGSSLIVNLRHPNDFKKAVMNQNELLKIAIANDANIAKARKDFRNAEPVFQTLRQSLSPEELQQDETLQINNAVSNLLDIGFRDQEANRIVSAMMITPDLVFKFNMIAKAIKEDIKKRFDVKLLTTTFFLDYLYAYIEELDESGGFSTTANSYIKNKFDTLTRSINDIFQTLPSRDDLQDTSNILEGLIRTGNSRLIDTISYTEEVLRGLIQSLPTEAEIAQATRLTQVDKTELLQGLQNIVDELPSSEDIYALNENLSDTNININQKIRLIEESLGNLNETLVEDLRQIKQELKQNTPSRTSTPSASFSIGSTPEPERRRKVPRNSPNATGRFSSIPFNVGSTTGEASDIEEPIRPKKGKGMTTKKIGKGVAIEEKPKHLHFGKYVIDKQKLDNQNILHFKHKSLGNTKFKPLSISDDTRDLMNDLLQSGKMNHKFFQKIPSNEQSYLYNVINGAGLLDTLNIKIPNSEDENRFEILKGEFLSGNNSIPLIKELRTLIIKFCNEGKISKKQMAELLIEIN
jgi:hypothetical protein